MTKKRIWALVIAASLAFAAWQGTTLAQDSHTVYVGGKAMTASAAGESWYTGGQVVAAQPASYEAHLYLDAANGGALTLELNGLTVSGVQDHAESKGAGIYTTDSLTIRYGGQNSVTASTAFDYNANPSVSFRSYDISYGIYANGLTLLGDAAASLQVTAVDVKGSSYGIYSGGALTAQGGTIVSRAGDTIDIRADWKFSSVGIYAAGEMRLTGSADISATAGNAYAGSYQESRSAGIMSSGDLTIENCTVEAVSEQAFDADAHEPSNYTYMRYSRGLYAQGGDITITGSSVTATAGDAYGLGTSVDSSAGILSYGGNIAINSGTVIATGGDKGTDPSYGICARQSSSGSTTEGILTISGGTITATGGDTYNNADYSVGMYAYNGITISGGTVTANAGKGLVSAGIDCDWDLTVSGNARVYATADEAKVYSYGIKVWNNYHQSGNAEVHATAVNTTGNTSGIGNRPPRSFGFYMGDSYNEQAGNANTFTITGGIFEARSLADGQSTTLPSVDTGGVGGEECALKFFDVAGNAATFSDGQQPNAQWYWWTLDPAHAAANQQVSTTKAYVYDDAEHNYLSKYLYIAPIKPDPETGDLSLTKTVSGEGADTGKAFTFVVTLGDATVSGVYGDMTFTNGVATVRAAHGQTVRATDLPAGITYSIVETEANQGGYTTAADGASGTILKDAVAKATFVNQWQSADTGTEVSVRKVWKLDDGGTATDSVTVALLRNGVEYGVATLREDNGWSHTWSGLDGRFRWSVSEKYVPEGFKASIEQPSANAFTIVNDDLPQEATDTEDPDIPPTGDTSGYGLWLALLLLAGGGLAATAAYGKRSRKGA